MENAHVQEGPEESEDRDKSRSHDSDHNEDPTDDLNRSQHESEPEGYALDQYEDYVEVEDYSGEDMDVVYIRAAWAMNHLEMEEILFRDLDATSISDMSTLVDENEVSMDLAIIPNSMTPYELLCMLTEETWLMVFCERNEARDPKWTPRYH
jgi:hypothetical protein